jgi:hypothetical protein
MNIEESIIEPVMNKMLKMVVATMSQDEFKWVMISGEGSQWVKVTKGLMSGKIKLPDLMMAGLVDPENINPETGLSEVDEMVQTMIENGQDPEEDLVFDVDWVVRVETGSLAEADSQKDIENKQMVISTGMQMGIPLDVEKLWKDLAMDAGVDEPEQYIMKGGQGGAIDPATGQPIGEQTGAIPPQAPQPNGGVPSMAGAGMPTPVNPVGV